MNGDSSWFVEINIAEADGVVRAEARLSAGDELTGVVGVGVAFGGHNQLDPRLSGHDVAVARSLADLSERIGLFTGQDNEALIDQS